MAALNSPTKKLPHPLSLVETRTGKVFLHRRIVVFPGAAQWINLENEVNAGDIIVYQIKFIPRSNCTIVRSTWVTLDAGEPSPPQVDGSEICFVRAPILFQPFLLNEMDSLKQRR
ncbi:hypothetical protein SDC9_150491 [bioreactor metagenome]|uniref:Uncharacterized protein n=1 Tax=bioreactor metagenome TaxID=1076179 RepID=A0A645ERW5_9ZZZZ